MRCQNINKGILRYKKKNTKYIFLLQCCRPTRELKKRKQGRENPSEVNALPFLYPDWKKTTAIRCLVVRQRTDYRLSASWGFNREPPWNPSYIWTLSYCRFKGSPELGLQYSERRQSLGQPISFFFSARSYTTCPALRRYTQTYFWVLWHLTKFAL